MTLKSLTSPDSDTSEIWRPVPFFKGFEVPGVEASSLGRVRRTWRLKTTGRLKTKVYTVWYDGRPGEPRSRVSILSKHYIVSRLVCAAFYGVPEPSDLFALHGDGDATNNKPANLRWGDRLDNAADAIRHGAMPRKLTERDVHEIREFPLLVACSPYEIAVGYGVTPKAIRRILNGETWKWL